MDIRYRKLCMEYIFLLEDDICNKYTKRKNIVSDVDFSKVKKNSKGLSALYEKMQKDIIIKIQDISKKTSCVNALKMAFFCERNTRKKLMYDNNLDDMNTFLFKVFNMVFCSILNIESKDRINFNKVYERNLIKKICGLSATYFNNMIYYNNLKYQKEDSINDFYDELDNKSKLKFDMHTYMIENEDLRNYLRFQSTDKLGIQEIVECLLDDFYFLWNDQIEKVYSEEAHKIRDITSDEFLDIIDKNKLSLFSNKMQKFILRFTLNCEKILDDYNFEFKELIFGYSDDKYLYIAKKIMMDTQEIIGNFCIYGQYNDLINNYYPNNYDKIKNIYNKFMTYKVADLLLSNNYIVPMEKKRYNSRTIIIPRIEIKDYPNTKKYDIGDIDVLFYSTYTNSIYILEYKNYEMFITSKGALEKEEKKINRDNVLSRMTERKQAFEENVNEVLDKYFKIHSKENVQVKSIVLSTKPNYYLRQCKEIYYLDWIDFKEKVDCKAL